MNAPHTTEDRLARSLQTLDLAALAAPFVDARVISDNHLQLADTLAAATGETLPAHVLIAALTLSAQERGHSALSLRPDLLPRMVPARPTDPAEADALTASLDWPGADTIADSPLAHTTPAVLEVRTDTHLGTTVQTHRLACEEQWVADGLLALCQPVPPTRDGFLRLDAIHRDLATAIFGDPAHPGLTVFDALTDGRLALVTGGPGTGKTWSIKRILTVFHAAAAARGSDQPFTVALAAPTGKAGVRMREAIREDLDGVRDRLEQASQALGLTLDAPAICARLEAHGASTLHRLLGIRPGEGSARHHADNPLPYDLVIVDEASMADLPMMRRLVQAIGPTTRLVLLGDRDQLPSVDVGAVLSDLVSPCLEDRTSPLCVAAFSKNYRSKDAKTLADLVSALQRDTDDALTEALRYLDGQTRDPDHPDGPETLDDRIRRLPPPVPTQGGGTDQHRGTHAELVEALLAPWRSDTLEVRRDGSRTPSSVDGYVTHLARLLCENRGWQATVSAAAEELFASFDAYRVLAVHRKGPLGVAGLGEALEKQVRRQLRQAWQVLHPAGSLPTRAGKWLGQAVLITRNDPTLGVYNGDVGLVLPDPATGELALALPRVPDPQDPPELRDQTIRFIALSRLPDHASAFVMTVHKSQGSQFAHTAVVLADRPSAIQTRELVYTGITRAAQKVTWVGTTDTLRTALQTRVLRGSLLEARITGVVPPDEPVAAAAQPQTAVAPAVPLRTRPSGTLPAHYEPLDPFLRTHMPVDGTPVSRKELNRAAAQTRGMTPERLDALLASEPRVAHVGRSWHLLERAPVQPGSPLDRATAAVLQSYEPLSGRAIMAAAELTEAEWHALRKPLFQQPAVEYIGVRRGAKYLSKARFDALWAQTEAELTAERGAKPHRKTIRDALEAKIGRLNER